MRIGVLSDTHIPYRASSVPGEVFTGLAGVDLIIHAGDICDRQVLTELTVLAPVEAVYGNVDPVELRQYLPRTRVVEVAGKRIGIVHGDGAGGSTPDRALRSFNAVDCVVFGHSHQAWCEQRGRVLLFNPGSATDRRMSPQFSYGILHVDTEGIRGEIIYFGPEKDSRS